MGLGGEGCFVCFCFVVVSWIGCFLFFVGVCVCFVFVVVCLLLLF